MAIILEQPNPLFETHQKKIDSYQIDNVCFMKFYSTYNRFQKLDNAFETLPWAEYPKSEIIFGPRLKKSG